MIRPIKTYVSGHGGGHVEAIVQAVSEDPNTIRANSIVRIVDILCEGEISGWGVDDNIYKSTYLNETPVMASDGTLNFAGVTLVARKGTQTQDYLPGFDAVEAENSPAVNTQITNAGGPVSRTISDTSIDDVRVTFAIPRLLVQDDNGNLKKTTLSYHITVTPDNGAGIEQTVITKSLTDKCVSEYRKAHLISNISQYGSGPWVIKGYRDTADSGSSKLFNDLYWYNFTTITNVKLRYPNTACVGLTFDLQSFGGSIPSRKYRINGRLISYPSNYTPATRAYAGIWDGTFVTGYCNNPAWVVYDIINNERFGCGKNIKDWAEANKWALYTIAQYCDGDVTYTNRERAADGTYSETSETLPRFTFNGMIQARAQALAVIVHLCSAFRGYPIWSTGMVSFVQDAPKTTTRIACPANVQDGFFEYEGTDMDTRTTAVNVSYTDMDNFGRPEIVNIIDQDGVARYGYNPVDLVAIGCNNPHEATLRGRYQLFTNLNQTDFVSFAGTIEWADALPGELMEIQDPDYADVNQSGRILASTTESITSDREIQIEAGITYTLLIQSATENAAHEVTLTNSVSAATDELTWSGAISPAPTAGMVLIVSSTATATREFEIMHVGAETAEGAIPIKGIEYSSTKYSEIETGVIVESAPELAIPAGKVAPPSGIAIQPHSYIEGDLGLRKYGMLISWLAADDARVMGYEVIGSYNGGGWYTIEQFVSGLSADYRDLLDGTYDIGVRAVGVAGKSNWVYFEDFPFGAAVDSPAPPTGLHCVDDAVNDYFTGPDCEISWTASIGSNYTVATETGNNIPFEGAQDVGVSNVVGYKIEVYDGTTLRRTHFTNGRDILRWTYTFAMNAEDNGTPIRNVNFRVYTVDAKGVLSLTYASLTAANPAPSMASITPTILDMPAYLDISWSVITDNDMDYYQIKADGAEIDRIKHPGNTCRFHDVEVGETYTIQIVPFDKFGIGTGSITDTGSPVVIPAVNLDVELSASMEKTDSDSNTPTTLEKLYDGVTGANGVSYGITDPGFVASSNMTLYSNSATRTGGTTGWNEQVYSTASYTGSAYVSFTVGQLNKYVMGGLNTDPTTDASFASIDYAWYPLSNGTAVIMESGTQVSNYGAYTTDTVFSIDYSGTQIVYKMDGVVKRTVTVASGITFYFDSSFYAAATTMNNIVFAETAADAEDKYIQYKYGIEEYLDRIAVYTADENGRFYVALSTDGITWTYLKADADHTVETGTMTVATDQADAATNYWQAIAGTNLALFPNNLVAKYVRLYMTGTYTTEIYELIPSRMLISELAAIGGLSAISANLGTVTAGIARSNDGDYIIDFGNKNKKIFGDAITIGLGENDKLDWIENSTTYSATLTAGTTYTPATLAAHVQTQMRAAGDDDTTVTYNTTTRIITIANSTLTTLSLLWSTGTNSASTCGEALGFDVSADDTGALTYAADVQAALRIEEGDLS